MSTTVQLDPDTERRLETIAIRTGKSKDFHVQDFLESGAEDIWDYELLLSAEETLERVREGEEPTSTLDEVSERLGLDD